jgi:TatD DNase family protein
MHRLVDTHCHLNLSQFDGDRLEVISAAESRGVRTIVVPATDLASCSEVIELASKQDNVYAAVGIHPNDIPAKANIDDAIDQLRSFVEHPKVIAIGEIGLDYYWDKTHPSVQKEWLLAQLTLVSEANLPVILHNRESTADLLGILHQWTDNAAIRESSWSPGVLHSFSGSWTDAEKALTMGFYLGFTGPLTYKNSDVMQEVAAKIPDNCIVIETDAPFLPPHPHRGKRNEPSYVELVAAKLAEIRETTVEQIAELTTQNARTLFRNRFA